MNEHGTFKCIVKFVTFAVLLSLASCKGNREVTTEELQDHIKYLASDSLGGRMTGSIGDSLAADYIKTQLSDIGFLPLAGDGFQSFEVTKRILPGKNNSLIINGTVYSAEKDYTPMAFSSNSFLEAEVIFAGYGLNIDTDSLKWNDYKDLEVKGKWVLMLRSDPETDNNNSPFLAFSGDRDKSLMAKDMGAAGVLMVSGPIYDTGDTFEPLNNEGFSVGIPVIRLKREIADLILADSKKSVSALEKSLNDFRKPVSFSTNVKISASTEIVKETTRTRNVVMELKSIDPQLKNEYIIIGAHFDHLGMGGIGSNSRSPDTTGVHHGADDNASGVAMMLELAEKFSMTNGSFRRSIICVAFTGEEEGLLGSKHFTDNPGINLSDVNAMINLDMLGRFNDSVNLQIFGTGTAVGLKDMIYSKSDTTLIKLTLFDEGYGPSDHSSFYLKNIPVLFYSTGAHLDYHTPNDTYDKINYSGMVKISDLIYSVASNLASSDSKMQFMESGPKAELSRPGRRKGVTLGIMPDFAGAVKNGLRVDAVSPGKPAAIGGILKGDIITEINGKQVSNIYDYMSRMGQLKHGQTISVEVLRKNKKEVLLIQL